MQAIRAITNLAEVGSSDQLEKAAAEARDGLELLIREKANEIADRLQDVVESGRDCGQVFCGAEAGAASRRPLR